MRYKLLGRSGLRVSELALGTMTFGEDWGWGAPKEECRRIFDAFAEAGGNFIDTANRYTEGTAETYLGEFLAADRDHFVLTTKYTLFTRRGDPNAAGNHRKNLVRSLEASLKRLRTDYVDVLWVHAWDAITPIDAMMRALDDVVRAGKVLHVGISDAPAWVVARANTMADLRGWSPFVGLQVRYSLVDRDAERDLLPMARALDVAVTAWAPLGTGVLTGKYNQDPAAEGRAGLWRSVTEKKLAIAREALAIAGEVGATTAQVALTWLRQQPGVVIPIVGSRRVDQLRENLASVDCHLTEEQMERLNRVSAIELGFPHEFLASEEIRDLISGGTHSRLDTHRPAP